MKEKLKFYLFASSIFYSITILLLIIFNISNSVTSIELFDSIENINKLNEYKKEVTLLEQNSCTNTINQMIDYYEQTSYNGKVNLKDIYNLGIEKSLLSFYIEIKENCDLTDKDIEKYNLPTKVLASSIQQDELLQNYYFQYELNLKDIFTRTVIEADISNTEYKISKNLQLEIIANLIELSNEEVKINE